MLHYTVLLNPMIKRDPENGLWYLGHKKLVYHDDKPRRQRTITGETYTDGDFFIVENKNGDLWIHRKQVLAVKNGGTP